MSLTLGSFFDGLGGWLVAAAHAGVIPKWRSEIDDFPAAVAGHHFPDVPNLGDITKIKAEDLEPVDIICAGSPCQDLSVAGKRAGLEGERSGLFRTAVRLVHELRARTGKPRYFVWENVPGAFSSNKGHDFRAVLEEISQTAIPMPGDNKWAEAGMVSWGQGSLAWRVLDAQYWGVPQRRKRIFLVADFAGQSAGEILFEPESVSGYSTEGRGERQDPAADVGTGVESTGGAVGFDGYNSALTGEKAATIGVNCGMSTGRNGVLTHNGAVWDIRISSSGTQNWRAHCYPATRCRALDTGGQDPDSNHGGLAIYDMTHADEVMRPVYGDKSNCLNSRMGTGGNQVPVVHTICGNIIGRGNQNGGHQLGVGKDVSYTLNTVDRHAVAVGYRAGQYGQYVQDDKAGSARASGGDLGGGERNPNQRKVGCLNASDYKGAGSQYVDEGKLVIDD